jgi:hypothetical protein
MASGERKVVCKKPLSNFNASFPVNQSNAGYALVIE